MKINIQVEHEKDSAIADSMKERTSMLKDFLSEIRKMQSMSMEKMMSLFHKMNAKKQDNSSSLILQAMRESGKMNQSMMNTMKSMADKKESRHEDGMKTMLESSNYLLKAMKDSMNRKPENKTVIVKTVNNNKSIENLTEAIRSGSFNRSRWIPSAS